MPLKFPQPLCWQSGQFLDPQHFQESDRYHNHLFQIALELSRPFPWGVRQLQVNAAALAEGSIRFDHAEILFPDGTYALWTGRRGEGNVYSLQCGSDQIPDGGGIIQAVLQEIRETENCVSEASSGAGRFVSVADERDTPDRYGVAGSDSINPSLLTRLYYNVQLSSVPEACSEAGFSVVPLMRVQRVDGKIVLDSSFIPPLYAITASECLMALITRLKNSLRDFPARLAQSEPSDVAAKTASLFTRQTAAGLLAELDSIGENPGAHPYEVYACLKRRHAELATTTEMVGMPASSNLPRYDHSRPGVCLPPLIERCEALVASNFPQVIACIEPVYDMSSDVPQLQFPLSGVLGADRRYVLLLPSETRLEAALREGRLIAGSPKGIVKAVRLALPRVRLVPVSAPNGLPSGHGNGYVSIDTGHTLWAEVVSAGELAVVYYAEPELSLEGLAAKARLYVLGGRG